MNLVRDVTAMGFQSEVPVSRNSIAASGLSRRKAKGERRKAEAPAGRKKGSFLPRIAGVGGQWRRK